MSDSPMAGKWFLATLTALRVVGVLFLLALPQFLSFKKLVFFVAHILKAMLAASIVKNMFFSET